MNINLNSGFANITTFAVSANNLSGFNVDWGDGTYSKSFPHTHQYSKNGNYVVRILGCNSLSSVTYLENVCVSNWIQPAVSITTNPISSYTGCGATFTACVSSLSPNMTLYFYSSGSGSVPYTYPEGFWDHLNPRWRFLDEDGDYISSATISGTPIKYGTETVAYSSCYTFQYVDDMPANNVILFLTLKTPHANSRVYSAVSHTVSALTPTKLCITEDGIRDIYELQWATVPIPYVISVCNDEVAGCSNLLHYTSGAIVSATFTSICTYLNEAVPLYTISLTDENCHHTGGYVLTSLTISETLIPSISTIRVEDDCNQTGIYELKDVRVPAHEAKITATAIITYPVGSATATVTLTGESNTFTVYPFEDYNKFRRKGESEDISETMNFYAFTDRMRNHEVLWNYLDALFGTDLESLGTRTYFGIERFVDQHQDLDRCNLNSLLDMAEKYDVNVDDYSLALPYEVRRILDMVSMPLEKIVGARCVCNTNFFDCAACCGGSICKTCGYDLNTNIGDQLTYSDYVTAGTSILYTVKGNDVYDIVPITQQNGQNVFQLNTLSANCFQETGIDKYCFYEWLNTPAGNPIESEIDYDSEFTTIDQTLSSPEDWFGNGGIVEEVLNFILLRGLELDE